jgi:hypothetical protein
VQGWRRPPQNDPLTPPTPHPYFFGSLRQKVISMGLIMPIYVPVRSYPLAGLKNKVSIYISGLLRNFAPNFCPFSNLKAQILEIWPSAPESAKKIRAAMKS